MADNPKTPAYVNDVMDVARNFSSTDAMLHGPSAPAPPVVGTDYASNLMSKYAPVTGRADKHSSNIPGDFTSIASNSNRFTGGMGGSNQ